MSVEHWMFLVLQAVILVLLTAQYLQSARLWRSLDHWQSTLRERQRRAYWHTEENRELRSALLAEKAEVQQLRSKLELMQATASAD